MIVRAEADSKKPTAEAEAKSKAKSKAEAKAEADDDMCTIALSHINTFHCPNRRPRHQPRLRQRPRQRLRLRQRARQRQRPRQRLRQRHQPRLRQRPRQRLRLRQRARQRLRWVVIGVGNTCALQSTWANCRVGRAFWETLEAVTHQISILCVPLGRQLHYWYAGPPFHLACCLPPACDAHPSQLSCWIPVPTAKAEANNKAQAACGHV